MGGNFDETFQLFAANEWLGNVGRYELKVELGGLDAGVDNVIRTKTPSGPESTPDFTYTGVGTNPQRLKLSEQQREIYVANGRGGEIALLNVAADQVLSYSGIGAPAVDIIEFQNNVFVSTTTPGPRPPGQDEQVPSFFEQPPTNTTGLNGATVDAHQGQLLDRTKAYNFEDIHNSIVALPANINQNNIFQQTHLHRRGFRGGELPGRPEGHPGHAHRRHAGQLRDGTLFVVGEGNDIVQQLDVNGAAAFPLEEIVGAEFPTGFTPKASFLDLVAEELVTVTWGGGLLETFALDDFTPLVQVDLGYATDNGQRRGRRRRVPVQRHRDRPVGLHHDRVLEQRLQVVRQLPPRRAPGRRRRLVQRCDRADHVSQGHPELQPDHHGQLLLDRHLHQRQLPVAGVRRPRPAPTASCRCSRSPRARAFHPISVSATRTSPTAPVNRQHRHLPVRPVSVDGLPGTSSRSSCPRSTTRRPWPTTSSPPPFRGWSTSRTPTTTIRIVRSPASRSPA